MSATNSNRARRRRPKSAGARVWAPERPTEIPVAEVEQLRSELFGATLGLEKRLRRTAEKKAREAESAREQLRWIHGLSAGSVAKMGVYFERRGHFFRDCVRVAADVRRRCRGGSVRYRGAVAILHLCAVAAWVVAAGELRFSHMLQLLNIVNLGIDLGYGSDSGGSALGVDFGLAVFIALDLLLMLLDSAPQILLLLLAAELAAVLVAPDRLSFGGPAP